MNHEAFTFHLDPSRTRLPSQSWKKKRKEKNSRFCYGGKKKSMWPVRAGVDGGITYSLHK